MGLFAGLSPRSALYILWLASSETSHSGSNDTSSSASGAVSVFSSSDVWPSMWEPITSDTTSVSIGLFAKFDKSAQCVIITYYDSQQTQSPIPVQMTLVLRGALLSPCDRVDVRLRTRHQLLATTAFTIQSLQTNILSNIPQFWLQNLEIVSSSSSSSVIFRVA